jgi:hypothetical protein
MGMGKLKEFDPLVLDSALKEKEVIVDKNIKLSKKDIYKVL